MKEIVIEILNKELKIEKEELRKLIETPPTLQLGDYAFPCFILAKERKKSPLEISQDLAKELRKKETKEIASIENKGPYVNFYLNKNLLAEEVIKETKKKNWGENKQGLKKTICIDLSAPNIAKPFGIGHLRSTIIGDSISKIANYNGYKTIKINYLGDWGTQFGKLILGYKKWGNKEKLEKDPIAHLQELYIKVNQDKELEPEARLEFKKLEEGDKENLDYWKNFKELSIKKFEEIYKILNIQFDITSGESKYNNQMQEVIEELEKKNLLIQSDGAKVVDLKENNKGVVLIQKGDGTSLYATRDIAAAIDRKKQYNFDQMIYEVGSEQKLHFQQIFKVLELMNYNWAKNCTHVSHGLYLDKDGKKFSTRKGKTVYLKDIINETIKKAKKNLLERTTELKEKELNKKAEIIAITAIKYGDLKNYRENNIIFDIDKFLEFEGDTGPYLLYSYARASSILRKSETKTKKEIKIIDLKDSEISLIKKIHSFPEIISKAHTSLSPNLIANYSYELAKTFNEFYHDCPVIGGIEESFRLQLVNSFKLTLKKSLNLLGIETLEEM
jgi:arginyl-tRNA synthetase